MNTHRHHPHSSDPDRCDSESAPQTDAGSVAVPPSATEIAALTRRLRQLSAAGADAEPAERARFLADKNALLARIRGDAPDDEPPDDQFVKQLDDQAGRDQDGGDEPDRGDTDGGAR